MNASRITGMATMRRTEQIRQQRPPAPHLVAGIGTAPAAARLHAVLSLFNYFYFFWIDEIKTIGRHACWWSAHRKLSNTQYIQDIHFTIFMANYIVSYSFIHLWYPHHNSYLQYYVSIILVNGYWCFWSTNVPQNIRFLNCNSPMSTLLGTLQRQICFIWFRLCMVEIYIGKIQPRSRPGLVASISQ